MDINRLLSSGNCPFGKVLTSNIEYVHIEKTQFKGFVSYAILYEKGLKDWHTALWTDHVFGGGEANV